MIEAFVGLVGGGKTFCSTRRMCEYIVRGGVVCTNVYFRGFDISSETFSSDSPFLKYLSSRSWNYQSGQYKYISFDDMVKNADWFHSVPAGESRTKRTLLCIDESTDLFDILDRNKLSSDSVYRELFRFLRLSRHAHIDVLFICQDFFAINSRLRGLVGAIWKSTDMQHFRLPTFHIPLPVNCFLLQKFDRTGKLELYREFLAKDNRIFAIYDSEAFHDDLGVTFTGAIPDGSIRSKRKMSTFQKFILFFCLVVSIFVLIKLRSFDRRFDTLFKEIHSQKVENQSTIKNGPEQVNSQEFASEISSASLAPPRDNFLRGDYNYAYYGKRPVLYFDDALIELGMITEFGKCIRIEPTHALCVDGSIRTFLLPCRRLDGPPKTTAFAPSSDGNAERAF